MKTLQIYGPFFTNYSLAKVNRQLALALASIQSEYKISIFCDRDQIDWWPSEKDLNSKPEVKAIFSRERVFTDIVIFNNSPKSINLPLGLKELPGKVKIVYTAWEEDVYPRHWVQEINENAVGVMTPSSFTAEVLKKNGVKVPIKTILNSIDENFRTVEPTNFPLDSTKKVKFFHISTGKQRKGVDLLIKGYFEEFNKQDDVSLVIKGFNNPDSMIEESIKKYAKEDSPEVVFINNPELSESELKSLYVNCDCGVFPSRAEGFGLPILECMNCNIPVITTNYSGQLDFCNEENSYLLDYKLEYAKDSEFVNLGAKWAEPDVQELKRLMRKVYNIKLAKKSNLNSDNKTPIKDQILELESKIINAKKRSNEITWINSAKIGFDFIKDLEKIANLKNKIIGVITWINSESGIAIYSKDLYSCVESSFNKLFYISNKDIADRVSSDEENVVRLWSSDESDFSETIKFVKENKLEIIHIQYHSGAMFSPESLDKLIIELKKLDIKIYITLHSIRSTNFNFIEVIKNLKLVDKVIVLSKTECSYVESKLNNSIYINHGAKNYTQRSKEKLKKELGLDDFYPIVTTHGLLNINKGVVNIIDSIKNLKSKYPKILLLGLNAVSPNNILATGLFEEISSKVSKEKLEENIILVPEFLNYSFVQVLLQVSDILIFAYSDVGEGASGAVNNGINSLTPLIVTDIPQFGEFKDELLKIKDNSVNEIVNGVTTLLDKPEIVQRLLQATKIYIYENSYSNISLKTLVIYS